jgi:hypothetical protein
MACQCTSTRLLLNSMLLVKQKKVDFIISVFRKTLLFRPHINFRCMCLFPVGAWEPNRILSLHLPLIINSRIINKFN